MTEIYLAEDHLLLKTGYGNPEMHSHSACHVLVDLLGDYLYYIWQAGEKG